MVTDAANRPQLSGFCYGTVVLYLATNHIKVAAWEGEV